MRISFLVLFALMSICTSSLAAQTSISYSVKFHANNSERFPGHVWVEFSLNGSTYKKVGFYMEGLQDETNRRSDVDYRFHVSKTEYEAALDIIDLYEDYPYIVGLHDCRSFAGDVAKALNLQVPSTGIKSPAIWLAELVELNQ